MSGNDDVLDIDFLDQYAGTQQESKEEYTAISLARNTQSRFIIAFDNDTDLMLPYANLLRAMRTGSTKISLVFSDTVITLIGKNLPRILPALREGRVQTITCFNPNTHTPPPSSDPFITEVIQQTPDEFGG